MRYTINLTCRVKFGIMMEIFFGIHYWELRQMLVL